MARMTAAESLAHNEDVLRRRIADLRQLGTEAANAVANTAEIAFEQAGQAGYEDMLLSALGVVVDTLIGEDETCEECETTGYNCSLHSGPEWRR